MRSKKNQTITKLEYKEHFILTTAAGTFKAENILLATGGASFPKIGATSIGLDLAKGFGHETRPFESALVGLSLQKDQFWLKELSGISLKATITVGKKSFTDWLLFAHKGISGPAVLSASLYWKKASIIIDFLPDKKLKILLKDPKKLISSQLGLPKRFIKGFLEAVDIEDKKVASLTALEKEKLSFLKSYNFAPAGNFGLSKAEATRGGILVDTIDEKSMQSTLQKGLYFAGEVVDVTGELGGYNFQWAFSSAYVAAASINEA